MIEEIDWFDWSDVGLREIRGRRVYVGDACCEKRLPSVDVATEVARRLGSSGIDLTFVTPFASERGLARIETLMDALRVIVTPLEVVCNDWGVLDLVAGRAGCVPIAGRLLVRQDTDPRWYGAMDPAFQRPFERVVRHVDGTEAMLRHEMPSPALVRHLQRCSLDAPAAYELLSRYGVRRLELNNLLQGIDVEPPDGWHVSIHVPDVLVALARDCAAMPAPKNAGAWSCRNGCPPPAVWRHESVPIDLIQRANAVYYLNPSIPACWTDLRIDRVVVNFT